MAAWLSKLFGGAGKELDANRPEQRRTPRMDAGEFSPPTLHVLLPMDGTAGEVVTAEIVNVSMAGCRLAVPRSGVELPPGKILVGTLVVRGEPIPLSLEVIRAAANGEWGMRFRPPFPRELEKLKRFLEPRFLGRSLREINAAALQRGDGDLRWFQGANDTHLFSWSAAGAVTQQQLVFQDTVVEWRSGEGIRTGRLDPDRTVQGAAYGRPSSDLIAFDARPDAAALESARAMLNASSIDARVRKTFLEKMG